LKVGKGRAGSTSDLEDMYMKRDGGSSRPWGRREEIVMTERERIGQNK
jgi:hypothetical protein